MTRKMYRLLLAIVLILSTACRPSSERSSDKGTFAGQHIIIQGLLENGAGKPVFLERMGVKEFVPIDTVICGNDNRFYIEFQAGETDFYALRCFSQGKGFVTLLLKPGEQVEFSGNHLAGSPYSVKGSEGSALIQKLASEHKKTVNAMAEISRKNRASIDDPEYPSMKIKLDSAFETIAAEFYDYSLRFIHENAGSLSILSALYNQYGYGLPVFNIQSDLEVYRFADSSLSLHFPENEVVQQLHTQIESASKPKYPSDSFTGPGKGIPAPDFLMNGPDGEPVALRDLRGNYVLLSFWASWSKPSREENRILREAYQRFKEKGFEIFQVSVDDSRPEWIRTIHSDSLNWKHVSELKRWDAKVIDLYAVDRIPSNFLISPNGIIVGHDLFGEDLINELEKIYK